MSRENVMHKVLGDPRVLKMETEGFSETSVFTNRQGIIRLQWT
jgi:hypothetical protein